MARRDPQNPSDAAISALGGAMAAATEEQIARALELIDSLSERGAADALIEKVRPRLRKSRPPHRLRFPRLLLYPLDTLIVSPTEWRDGDATLPRNALVRMAHHVRNRLGPQAETLDAAIAEHTTEDTTLVEKLGRELWPTAGRILMQDLDAIPGLAEEVGRRHQRRITVITASLLTEAPAILALIAGTANGLLPPHPDAVEAIAERFAAEYEDALPGFLAILLARVPQACATLDLMKPGANTTLIRNARDQAAETLLRRLDDNNGLEAAIEYGPLPDAGRAARNLVAFLDQFGGIRTWRVQVQQLRARLAAACQTRFIDGIETDILDVVETASGPLEAPVVLALEASARGLRLLDEAARSLGGGSIYDELLKHASETIGAARCADRLSLADRSRLIEVLSGPEAALAILRAA
jgi:hypothetical protein